MELRNTQSGASFFGSYEEFPTDDTRAPRYREYQSPPSVLPTHAMSAPFVARARLHVIGSTCRFAGVMPAPKLHSDRPGFDRLDRLNHVCRLTSDAAHLLVSAAAVTFSLRYVRASCLPPLRSCPGHVSSRSEAPWHASADAHSSCVPSPPCASSRGSPGGMSCPEPGSFDRLVSCASGRLPWVG